MIEIQKKLNEAHAELRGIRVSYRNVYTSLKETQEELQHITTANEIVQKIAQMIQEQAHQKIAEVVSNCLSAVFDEPYIFKILFERKRNRTEAKLVFERNGMEIDPMTASGGGVIDVASFALRISCLMLNKPPLRKVLIMDEPFKYVSEEYRDRVRILLETLSEEMGIQFIMVTHIQELKTGTVYEIE